MTSLLAALDSRHTAQLEQLRKFLRLPGEGAQLAQRLTGYLDDWLLDEEQREALRGAPEDVYLLFAGVFLLAAEHRSDAGNTGADILRQHWEKLGLTGSKQAQRLAAICRNAVSLEQEHQAPPAESATLGTRGADDRLISAAVGLALALDLDAPPTVARIERLVAGTDKAGAGTLVEHYQVLVIGPHPYLAGTIRVQVNCRRYGAHRALKRYECAIQELLNQLNRRISPRFLYSDIVFEITPDGYRPADLRFTVDSTAALQLFMGNRLYSDKRVYLRELIQNAVDACNLRKLSEDAYTPRITIDFNPDISVITIRDNGIGMSRQWIEKYFLKIGISFYQSDALRNTGPRTGLDINFISQFGIGFLSSFLVAERIVIRTRKAGQPGLMIAISDLNDYFDVRNLGDDFAQGTEVALHLKPSRINYCRSLEFVGYLKTNIRFLSVPVNLSNERGETITIGGEEMAYKVDTRRSIDYVARMALDPSEGYLLLRAKQQTDYIQGVEGAKGGVSIFQDGIFVTQVDALLPERARGIVVGRINLLGGERCELSMDRNRIFWTDDQFRRLKRITRYALVDAVNQFMVTMDKQAAPEQIRRSIVNHLSICFDFNEVDDFMHARLSDPIRAVVDKRFRDFYRIHFAHAISSAQLQDTDGYNHAWQQRIIATVARRSRLKN